MIRASLFLSASLAALLGAASPGELAVAQSWQAENLLDDSRFEAAVEAFAASIPTLTTQFGEAHTRTLIAINNYATGLLQLNRGGEAEAVLRDALDRRQRAGLGEDTNLAATLNNLGEALLMNGRPTAAIAIHERALALRRRLYPDGTPEIASSLTNLAEALRQANELTRARALFEQAADLWAAPARGHTGIGSLPLMPGYARAKNSLGLLYDAENKRKPAEEAYTQALSASLRAYGASHEFSATLHFNLAGHYAQHGDWRRADDHCRQAINVFELRPAFHDEDLAAALRLHASILDHLHGRKSEAGALRRRADSILSVR
jgi:tetratricopeptide (TPR) repeat protein